MIVDTHLRQQTGVMPTGHQQQIAKCTGGAFATTGRSGQSSPMAAACVQSSANSFKKASAAGRLSSVPKRACVMPSAFSRNRKAAESRPVITTGVMPDFCKSLSP